jgi:hypothetical protein
MTMGVTMPSFKPLSTVMSLRILDGTARLVTTGRPRAASVGARAAATSRASQTPSCGNSQYASAQPARTVSGSPTASSRTIRPRSRRISPNGTPAASENSTHTNVTSTSGLSVSLAAGAAMRPVTASIPPMATKTIGAVRSSRSSRPDRTPQRYSAPLISKIAVVSTSAPGSVSPMAFCSVRHPLDSPGTEGWRRPTGGVGVGVPGDTALTRARQLRDQRRHHGRASKPLP